MTTASKSRSLVTWVVVLLLLAGGAFGGWRWYASRSNQTKVDYKTGAVARGDITQKVTANGSITPVKSVTVGSQVSGIIVDIKADFNSRVTNGQVLAQIDPSTYQQNTNQADADLASARAGEELAELNFKRAKELRANELIAQADYDAALVALHQAQATTKTRQAALKKCLVDLERTTIYSPIDGVVISRAVDVGQTVAASLQTPTLFNIANDLRMMEIDAAVSEADVGGVLEGQTVNFTVDAHPNRQFQGKITQVRFAPVTNQNVVNYIIVVSVNNDDLKLRPGMTANAYITTGQKLDVLRVPNAALRFRPPEGAVVLGDTNKMSRGAGTNVAAADPPAGLPDLASMTPEERKERFKSMTPEERAKMKAMFGGGRGGEGGGPGGRGGMGGGRSEGSGGPRTLYLVETNQVNGVSQVQLKPVSVRLGITDGAYTEVLSGLKENDVVATGVNLPGAAPSAAKAATSSPFGPPGGGGFRPPGR
jgi:HlyD family secretion protein